MLVSRYNSNNQTVETLEKPIKLNYGTEELLFVMDQSSTCTALTVGDKDGRPREFITFERDKRKGETTGEFLKKVEVWLYALLENCNVINYSIEAPILTSFANSDKVTKQVRGVLINVYHTAKCIDGSGNTTYLTSNAETDEINNKEWKGMIVPKEYFQHYKDDSLAVFNYMTSFLPFFRQMSMDIADSTAMYLFLVKTRYSGDKLKATRSAIHKTHSLVAIAFPFIGVNKYHPELMALADEKGASKLNKAQVKYLSEYKKSVVRRYISLLNEEDYIDEYIESNKRHIDSQLASFIKLKDKDEFEDMSKEAKYVYDNMQSSEILEFEFNDNLTVEENIRCFTSKNRNIYFSVMPKSLHYCYAIPMFGLTLGLNDNILLIGTKY